MLMKKIVKVNHHRSFALIKSEVPRVIKIDDVKLKMIYSGICGTDVHIYHSDAWAKTKIKPPHVNGHEGIGQIVEVGRLVSNFKVGDYVSFESHIYCNDCRICALKNYHVCRNMKILGVSHDGVWSEFVVLPERILFKVDSRIPLKYAAILEPFGNAYHTQSYSDLTNKNVLVVGDGPIGLFCALIARTKKPKRLFISGTSDARAQIAKNCALHYLDATKVDLKKELATLTAGEGIDVILECSGSESALQQSLTLINECGDLNIISLYPKEQVALNLNTMIFKNLRLQLVTGRKIWATWKEAAELIRSKTIKHEFIDQVITHVLPFSDFEKGFQAILANKAGKVLLSFDHPKK